MFLKNEFSERLALTGNNLTRLCANSVHGSVQSLEKQGLLPPLGEASRLLRYEATIAALKAQEVATQKTIQAILQSRTFRFCLALAKLKLRITRISANEKSLISMLNFGF